MRSVTRNAKCGVAKGRDLGGNIYTSEVHRGIVREVYDAQPGGRVSSRSDGGLAPKTGCGCNVRARVALVWTNWRG